MTKRGNTHYKALEYLAEHPSDIGISQKDVLTSSIEQYLYYKGKFYCRIDLVFELTNNKAIIVEYKSNGHGRLVERGTSQLVRAVDYYKKVMGKSVEGRLIIGDYKFNIRVKPRKSKKPQFETKSKNR